MTNKLQEELDRLAALARPLVVDGRPAVWRSQGMRGPISGCPMYNVYTDEEFGDVVASLHFSQDDPAWDREAHAKFIAACNPAAILAMAQTLAELTSDPVGYIDPSSLQLYRGRRSGGQWSPEPKTGVYNQTLPIYLIPRLKPTITRYDLVAGGDGFCVYEEQEEDGKWVKYSDLNSFIQNSAPISLTISPINPLLSEQHQAYARGYKAGLEAAKEEIIKAGYPVNVKDHQ